jgi:hypothetical protein
VSQSADLPAIDSGRVRRVDRRSSLRCYQRYSYRCSEWASTRAALAISSIFGWCPAADCLTGGEHTLTLHPRIRDRLGSAGPGPAWAASAYNATSARLRARSPHCRGSSSGIWRLARNSRAGFVKSLFVEWCARFLRAFNQKGRFYVVDARALLPADHRVWDFLAMVDDLTCPRSRRPTAATGWAGPFHPRVMLALALYCRSKGPQNLGHRRCPRPGHRRRTTRQRQSQHHRPSQPDHARRRTAAPPTRRAGPSPLARRRATPRP